MLRHIHSLVYCNLIISQPAEWTYGRVFVNVSNEELARFGPDVVLASMLHEGGHAAGGLQDVVYTRCDAVDSDTPGALAEQYAGRLPISNGLIGGLRIRDLNDLRIQAEEANPWEEAAVELGVVKAMTRLDRVPQLRGFTSDREIDGAPINYAGPNYDGPNIDPNTGAVFIPFNFSTGVHFPDEGGIDVSGGASATFAYGLHLLE